MAGTKISDATLRSTLQGTESIPLVDTDLPKGRTTAANLKTYCTPDLSGYAEKAGAEFTGTIAAPIVAFMRESRGMMAAIQADSNNILFRTYNAGVDSITFQVQSSMPLKLTEGGIQENGIPLENKYARLTDLDQLATKTEVSSTYQPKGDYLTTIPSEYVTETELNEKGYLTEHQDISGLATKEELNSKADKIKIEDGGSGTVSKELQPNILYKFGECANLTITLAATTNNADEFMFTFDSGATATVLSIPETIISDSDFVINTNSHYEVSIRDIYLVYKEWIKS